MKYLWLLLLSGCASIVAPGQTRQEMADSGALRWVVTEYDFAGSHYVWIPHWSEGILNVSTPHASNIKRVDVLEFKGDILMGVEQLGDSRDNWAAKLKAHGRLEGQMNPLYVAVTSKVINTGAPLECVLFAAGFPKYGAKKNPACCRDRSEIKADDVLYYLVTRGGAAKEVVMQGGKVSEIRDAEHLGKDWNDFYHRANPNGAF